MAGKQANSVSKGKKSVKIKVKPKFSSPKKVPAKSILTKGSKKFNTKKVTAGKKRPKVPSASSSGRSGPSSEDDDRSSSSEVEIGKIVETPQKKRTRVPNYDDKQIEVLLKLCFKNYNTIDGNISSSEGGLTKEKKVKTRKHITQNVNRSVDLDLIVLSHRLSSLFFINLYVV